MYGGAANSRLQFGRGAARQDIALREPKWPKRTTQLMNAFSNQFELPVLFYVLTILEYVTHLAGIVFVVLAWVFVIFRILHAYVHVTSNIVRLRGALYVGARSYSRSCG